MPTSLTGRLLAAAALVAVVVGSGGAAYADEVTNDLDNTVDATAEALSLSLGAADGTVKLYVLNQNKQQGDTVVPCNLAGTDNNLVVDVVSSDQTVATVSPGQPTIADCGIGSGVSLTVRALKAGTSTVTVTKAPGPNPPGTFDFAPATFTVTVTAPANTAPRVRVAGAEDGAVYELGGYSPDLACIVTDAEDSPGSPIAVAPVVDDDRDGLGLGQVSASCSYTDAGGLTAQDDVTFTVVDTVAPTMQRLSLLPAPNAAGWNDSPVTATWGCFDAGSDVRAMEVMETTVGEGTDLTLTGTCEDQAGNTTSDSIDNLDVDLTDPVVTIGRSPAANDEGWNDGDVTVTWTCTDTLSGITDAGGAAVLGEGADQSATGTCTDRAGNTATDEVTDVNVDKTAPLISIGRSPAANAAGWNSGDVTVAWTCSDALSGPTDAGGSTVLGEGADQSATGTCTDRAGNTATDEVIDVDVDKTAPTVSWIEPIGDGAAFYFGSVPPVPGCAASDSLSGLPDTCSVTGYGTVVGEHTLTARAVDRAGNETALRSTYTVRAWTLNGYYKPVDMNGVWNTVKNGSTVPLKFEAFMGGTEITDVATLGATFTVKGVTCPGAGAATDDVELTTTGGTTFRYDAAGGQFIQNWQTPKKTGACYQVITTTVDGSIVSALFKLK